jgi:hypothetical protein
VKSCQTVWAISHVAHRASLQASDSIQRPQLLLLSLRQPSRSLVHSIDAEDALFAPLVELPLVSHLLVANNVDFKGTVFVTVTRHFCSSSDSGRSHILILTTANLCAVLLHRVDPCDFLNLGHSKISMD